MSLCNPNQEEIRVPVRLPSLTLVITQQGANNAPAYLTFSPRADLNLGKRMPNVAMHV